MRRQTVILLVVLVMLFAVSPVMAAEEGGSPLDSLGINVGFLIAQLVNFGLIFGLLTVFMWRPITNMLDERSARIEKGLEDAAAAANARRNAEVEADKILAQARSESAQVIEEARTRGEEVARQIEAEARTEAEKIREDSRIAAKSERDAQLADLRDQVVAISVAMSQRIIGESLDQKRQQALVNDFFAKVPAEAKTMGDNVQVVSAMPLSDDEQSNVRQEIGADNIEFVVDPAILGGLLIRSGDRVVDGTVRSSLTNLSSSLR